MCSLRKGVTVLPIRTEDIFVTPFIERFRSSSFGRSRLQFLSLLCPPLPVLLSCSARGAAAVLFEERARCPTR